MPKKIRMGTVYMNNGKKGKQIKGTMKLNIEIGC